MNKITFREQGIQEWISNHPIPADMRHKARADLQMIFVRDRLTSLLVPNISNSMREKIVRVIGTHISKSITLPVYKFDLKGLFGLDIILRDNFHDWKVSIDSLYPIPCDFMGLFDPEEKISPVYCEGFPSELVFGSFKNNPSQFTVEIGDNYRLYTFMWILNNYIKSIS